MKYIQEYVKFSFQYNYTRESAFFHAKKLKCRLAFQQGLNNTIHTYQSSLSSTSKSNFKQELNNIETLISKLKELTERNKLLTSKIKASSSRMLSSSSSSSSNDFIVPGILILSIVKEDRFYVNQLLYYASRFRSFIDISEGNDNNSIFIVKHDDGNYYNDYDYN